MSRAGIVAASAVAILFSMGLLMVFNTTSAEILDRSLEMNVHLALFKQIAYGLAGLCLGIAVFQIGYEPFLRSSWILLVITTVLLICTFIPGIGQTINGARRWIGAFGVTFQPSELIKILLPAFYIRWFLSQKGQISFQAFIKMLATACIPIALILLEPDNGTTAILLSLLVVLFFLTRIRLSYWALPLTLLVVVGGVAAYNMPHVPDRIRIYLHPELDLRGKGHQPHQAKIAAGSGRLLGRGFGESLQKLNYLPEARSDYIAAIYAEETGFIGMLAMIGLYMMVTCGGFLVALRAREKEGFYFASILTFLISIQAFLNLGIVSGLLPSKGMTLPFFSQGGSSLIVHIVALFLLLDIARKQKEPSYGS